MTTVTTRAANTRLSKLIGRVEAAQPQRQSGCMNGKIRVRPEVFQTAARRGAAPPGE